MNKEINLYESLGSRIRRNIETHTVDFAAGDAQFQFGPDDDIDPSAEPTPVAPFIDTLAAAEVVHDFKEATDLASIRQPAGANSTPGVAPSDASSDEVRSAVEAAAPQGAD